MRYRLFVRNMNLQTLKRGLSISFEQLKMRWKRGQPPSGWSPWPRNVPVPKLSCVLRATTTWTLYLHVIRTCGPKPQYEREAIGRFRAAFSLCFETSPNTQPLIWKWGLLARSLCCKSGTFPCERLCNKTRSETEVKASWKWLIRSWEQNQSFYLLFYAYSVVNSWKIQNLCFPRGSTLRNIGVSGVNETRCFPWGQ